EESHELSQNDSSREGSYWHAIAHRIEPDSSNSNYWFRKVGRHPIFLGLHEQAAVLLANAATVRWRLKPEWDPALFNQWCGEARQKPGSAEERLAEGIQNAECSLLLEWCTQAMH
ncbi:MAG: hypothetical protein M3Y72_12085, partial [Acidobacteriota bacterium]|nr:hypothetical protein [Acidobacteriota bacterium]